MKNVSGGNNKKLEMSGTLVNKDGENLFQRISFAEIIGFDKCPYLKRPEELHKDAYFYNFAQDEEIETVPVDKCTGCFKRCLYVFWHWRNRRYRRCQLDCRRQLYVPAGYRGRELESKKEKHCERAVSYRMGKSRKK